jgi:hypothetical protein
MHHGHCIANHEAHVRHGYSSARFFHPTVKMSAPSKSFNDSMGIVSYSSTCMLPAVSAGPEAEQPLRHTIRCATAMWHKRTYGTSTP